MTERKVEHTFKNVHKILKYGQEKNISNQIPSKCEVINCDLKMRSHKVITWLMI